VSGEERGHVGRDGRFEVQSRSVARMWDREAPGVQERARTPVPAVVERVAGDGETRVREMDPHLVGAAGERVHLHQRELVRRREPPHLGSGGSSTAADPESTRGHGIGGDSSRDDSERLAGVAAHDGEIALVRTSLCPRTGEGAGGVVLAGEQQHAGREAVEAVKEKWLEAPAVAGRELERQALLGRELSRRTTPRRLGRDARGLVDGDQPVDGVQSVEPARSEADRSPVT